MPGRAESWRSNSDLDTDFLVCFRDDSAKTAIAGIAAPSASMPRDLMTKLVEPRRRGPITSGPPQWALGTNLEPQLASEVEVASAGPSSSHLTGSSHHPSSGPPTGTGTRLKLPRGQSGANRSRDENSGSGQGVRRVEQRRTAPRTSVEAAVGFFFR